MYCEKKSNYLIRWRYLCSSSLLYGLCSSYVPTSASISNGLPELARHMLCSHEPIATPIFLFIFEVGVTISPLKPRNYRVEWNWSILYVIVCFAVSDLLRVSGTDWTSSHCTIANFTHPAACAAQDEANKKKKEGIKEKSFAYVSIPRVSTPVLTRGRIPK